MKKIYNLKTLLLVVLIQLAFTNLSNAQELCGTTTNGGATNEGLVFNFDVATATQTVKHSFNGSDGKSPYSNVIQASNGLLYGMTTWGGSSGFGVIFKYDPATDTYTKTHEFDGTNGRQPWGSLMEASNGLLYGMTKYGGSSDNGVIFKYDPATDIYTKTLDFNNTNGRLPYGSLMEASNGMLYGMTRFGGSSEVGLIFKYDPATDAFTKTHDFNYSDGGYPYGSLMQASNGLLYGLTWAGGSSGLGVIFKYDPATDTQTKTHDFNNSNGKFPHGRLMQASNGLLYGMTYQGGSSEFGLIFKYDPATDIQTKTHDFGNTIGSGSYPRGSLMEASNGMLYGCTSRGGTSNRGVLFSYSASTDLLTKLHDFNIANGNQPYHGSLVELATSSTPPTNNALHFDGFNDWVDAGATSTGLPQSNGARTIEAWVNISATAGFLNILSWGTRSNNQRSSIGMRTNHLAYVGQDNDTDGSIVINDGLWHHVAVSYDGTTVKLYVDGVFDFQKTTTLNTTGQNLRIGMIAYPHSGEYWNGMIDEVRIWDRALSQTEIQANMNTELAGDETDLLVYYDFNEGDAGADNTGVTTLPDVTSNNMDGTLLNFALNGSTSNWVGAVRTYTWTGTVDTDWNTAGNWNTGTEHGIGQHVIIPSAPVNQPVISGSADAVDLTTEVGSSLTLASDAELTVSGDIENNGQFTIQSDASGSGSLLNSGAAVNNGTHIVNRHTNTDRWHTFSPSVSGEQTDVFHYNASTGFDVYLMEHAESSNQYSYVTATNEFLNPLEGYLLWGDGDVATPVVTEWTYELEGDFNSGTFGTVNGISKTATDKGWNLLGNPYPSTLDWNSAYEAATTSNIDATVYVYTGSNWASWNSTVGGLNGGSQYIAPGQGFFIRLSSIGNGTFMVTDNDRVHDAAPFLKNAISNIVKLQVTDGMHKDETAVVFSDEASIGFDEQYDAHKLFSYNEEVPQIYSHAEQEVAVNVLPEIQSVPLYLTAEENEVLTVSVVENNYFEELYLEDLLTGEVTYLNQGEYQFTHLKEMEQRLILHFNTLNVEDIAHDNSNVYSYSNTVFVKAPEYTKGKIEIYNMMGQMVTTSSLSSGLNSVVVNQSGHFIVKIISDNPAQVGQTKKVFIK